MQQLLGEKASGTDASFLWELFLQQVPSNVRMVLASTNTTSLDHLAQLVDQIMEVATSSIQMLLFHRSRAITCGDSSPQETSTVIAYPKSMISATITLPATITQSFTIYTKQKKMLVSSTFWKFSTLMSTTLQHVGKHEGHSLVVVSVAGQSQSHLFYITDCNSGIHLLVDTGAEVSVVPLTNTERKHHQDGFILQAVNCTPIKTYGTQLITLNLSLRQTF